MAVKGAWSRQGLQARVVLLVGVGMLAPLAILGWASWASLEELGRQLSTERQLLAKSVADHLEYVVRSTLEILQEVSSAPRVDLEDLDLAPERAALRGAYLHSHFLEAVFLVGAQGNILWEEPLGDRGPATPFGQLPLVEEAFRTGRPTVSDLVANPTGSKRLYALVPLRNWRGRVVGLVGGEIDPESPRFTSLLQHFRLGESGSADLVDSHGVVIATTDPGRLYTESDHRQFIEGLIRDRRAVVGTCHGCHESHKVRGRVREVMAFSPLSIAPWGISIRQREDEAFAAIGALRQKILWLGPILLAVALLFAWGAARGVRTPLAVLTEAAERITSGDLTRPIPALGEDEVGRLGRSLEGMRVALKESLAEVARTNQELERRVEERTRELEELYHQLREREEWRGQLLRKVISAQEEERKRIARELHDETSQTLAALVMALETALPALPPGTSLERLGEVKALAVRTLEEVHRLILDLRPSVLDDLGLLSAIRWYAERHLEPLGITVHYEFSGPGARAEGREPTPEVWVGRLPPQMETALFRVVQEAITNIAKHAQAETVLIQCALREGRLTIEVEDDGKGFDPSSPAGPAGAGRGLGLLGVRERVELLGGTVTIESSPGQGARIALTVPVPAGERGV